MSQCICQKHKQSGKKIVLFKLSELHYKYYKNNYYKHKTAYKQSSCRYTDRLVIHFKAVVLINRKQLPDDQVTDQLSSQHHYPE